MQPVSWYLRRLLAMSPAEAFGRVADAARDAVDASRVGLGWTPRPPRALLHAREPRFRVSDVAVGEWAAAPAGSVEAAWHDRLVRHADDVAAHRLSFFDLEAHDLGQPIDWNRDPTSGRRAPLRFGRFVDYRDHSLAGDCKLVWEPNRHHHLVVLGRAYRATADERYARALVEQLESWLLACPFGRGMNWRSTLELGIRLINWVWALDLVRESGLPGEPLRARVLESVHQHVWEIARRYSGGSSANNHLIGEAAGAFVATAYFAGLDPDGRLHRESREILAREILRQSHEDGGTCEQALGYQVFVIQFFLVVDAVARAIGEPMPPSFEDRLERMLGFVRALAEGGDQLPAFGDADDGYVLDLGSGAREWRSWLGAGAVRFDRPDFAREAGISNETARWLLGRDAVEKLEALRRGHGDGNLASTSFTASGHFLLQAGSPRDGTAVSVVFDCGELGFGSIAAHGHADALSFTLRAFGRDILVDPGTYDYFTYPEWRRYFRSTRAHNTVEIDGVDQSTMEGPFLWGQRARARCLSFEPRKDGGRVSGEHDGYRRLADPALHRRTLELGGSLPVLVVTDEILAQAPHDVAIHFHVAETAEVTPAGERSFDIRVEGGVARLTFDEALRVELLRGSLDPLAGWVSRGYHRRSPSTTLLARTRTRGPLTLVCRIELQPRPVVPC
jgi:Heparinase II/III-like protein/Heparinase II/III N-terminus